MNPSSRFAAMTQDILSAAGGSQWHSVRPWTSRLLLSIRDITSVSVTFVLTSAMDPPDLSMDLAALGLDESELYEENPIPDLLGRELAVKVDKMPWQNVLVDVSDGGEEAIIVLYGLMPARHYEIELTVVSVKEPFRKHVVTDIDSGGLYLYADIVDVSNNLLDVSLDDHTHDLPEAFNGESSAPKTVPLPSPSQSPPQQRMITIEERAAQLRHNLSLLSNEKDSLLSQLKNARRDTQRAESSLRAEMDALKRASEKQSATEHRTRQKVLALQEAVKQALAAAQEAEAGGEQAQASIPSTELRLQQVEEEYARDKEEAKQSATEAESSISAAQKRVADLQNELSTLTHRLDRLNGKKERLENETIPELETELNALRNIYEGLEKGDNSGTSREEPCLASISHTSQLSTGSSHKARFPPIGRPPNISPRLVNKTPRRPGILNVQHILQRTP
jgi:vacuolar-type H+-ATPase subunit D/Vma8